MQIVPCRTRRCAKCLCSAGPRPDPKEGGRGREGREEKPSRVAAEQQTAPVERETARVWGGEWVHAAKATFWWGWQGRQSSRQRPQPCFGWTGSSTGSRRVRTNSTFLISLAEPLLSSTLSARAAPLSLGTPMTATIPVTPRWSQWPRRPR